MKVRTFIYSIGQGIKSIWRNKLFSMASIATMSACIFLFGIFYSIGTNFSAIVRSAEESVAVTVFFDEGITADQINRLGQMVYDRPEVKTYNYISAEEAWETFKVDYFDGKEYLAEGFADDNPLANSANFEIYLNDVSMQSTLVRWLESQDGVRQVNKSEVAAETLSDINAIISIIFFTMFIILLAVAVFLISNTIHMGITVRREEISIMKLIGAKDNFVRAPFVIEGIIIGFLGAIIPLAIIFLLYERALNYISTKFLVFSSMVTFIPADVIFKTLIPIAIVLGIGIGWIGSRATLKKHLKV